MIYRIKSNTSYTNNSVQMWLSDFTLDEIPVFSYFKNARIYYNLEDANLDFQKVWFSHKPMIIAADNEKIKL